MDFASLIGLVLCAVLVVYGITTGNGFGALENFWDKASVFITFGGALSCILASYSTSDFFGGLKSFTLIFKVPASNTPEIIKKIIELSNVARKEGLLALEEASNDIEDPFLKKGILLIVDGTDPELVRAIMETELVNIDSRHRGRINFWKDLGAMGPAWGMIGTLIGLVNMLKKLSDPDAIGPQMAVALITTFYGSLLANWICTPVATKLTANNEIEMMTKEIMIEGLLSIQAGENPRVIEEKLKSFLAPSERLNVSDEAGGEVNG